MITTATKVMAHETGRTMMCREDAFAVAEGFREIGGFARVGVSEFGCDSGCYEVELRSVNARTGNRTLVTVAHVPESEKEYRLIAAQAQGKARKQDAEALGRMAARREAARE